MSDSRRVLGLEIRFTGHFSTLLVTALNYSAITDIHTLQITIAHAKSFQFAISPPIGRAIAEAVSRWLPTAAARVRARVWQVGFVVDTLASGHVFSDYFNFPYKNR
jgi:hypothetical protein